MVTGAAMTTEDLVAYRATMRARDESASRELERRREDAWHEARRAAAFLRGKYGAERVVVFGSLAHEHWFTARSDIDLAVWGLGPEAHLLAVAALQDSVRAFEVDLVRAEWVSPALLSVIDSEGVDV